MVEDNNLSGILATLDELCQDNTVPRNVKAKFQEIIILLNDSVKPKIKINKALHDLDEINDDTNLQPYVRTQIWNLVSMLEKLGV